MKRKLSDPYAHNSDLSYFRIDHLLGRNLIENLTVLRFSNLVFEPLWSHKYIRNVQVFLFKFPLYTMQSTFVLYKILTFYAGSVNHIYYRLSYPKTCVCMRQGN